MLSMFRDSDLAAHLEDGAGGAVRADAFADVFAEWNEQGIDLDPITPRKFLL